MAEGDERIHGEEEELQEEVFQESAQNGEEVEEEGKENEVDAEEIEKSGKEEEVMAEEREEKAVNTGEESKFLTYAAVGLAIVALFFSFWGFSTQLKEKKLEAREAALEKKVEKMGKAQLVSDFTLKAAQVYMLTMVDRNYAAAQKVVSEMKAEAAAFGESGAKLNALLNALEAEVKKGPSPIPGLVNALSAEVKAAAGMAASVAPAPKAVVKPAPKLKIEEAPAKAEAKKAEKVEKAEKAEKKVEKVEEAKKEAAPAKKTLAEPPHPGKEPGGITSSMFHMWQKLSPYSE